MFFRVLFFLFLFSSVYSEAVPKDKTRILSIDGGGVRGVVALEFLEVLEKDSSLNCYNDFDVFTGTSTGAIIAVFLACGIELEKIMEYYKALSADVFSEPSIGLFSAKYDAEKLRYNIEKILASAGYSKSVLLSDLPRKVVIPVVELYNKEVKRWRIAFRENITNNCAGVQVIDALLETTAAPTYFKSYNGCIDGGIGMPNPSIGALALAYGGREKKLDDFYLLSLGSGYNREFIKGDEDWGDYQWLLSGGESGPHLPLLSISMDLQYQLSDQICSIILGDRYKRVTLELSEDIALDDYERINDLINFTTAFIANNHKEWIDLCNWVNTNIEQNYIYQYPINLALQ